MTLIAAFHPGGKYLALMSDVLISSRDEADSIILPTRGYISPEQERRMPTRPAGLRRKIIQINPKFVILWSGDYGCAEKLAKYAKEWFSKSEIDKNNFILFLSTYYKELDEKKYLHSSLGTEASHISASPVYPARPNIMGSTSPQAAERSYSLS